MIHFYDDIIRRTLEVINEAHDCLDVLNDLNRIDQAIVNVRKYGDYTSAQQLDFEMHQKYLSINDMLQYANSIRIPMLQNNIESVVEISIIDKLEQDRFGIIGHTAIKKLVIKGFKDYIKNVD